MVKSLVRRIIRKRYWRIRIYNELRKWLRKLRLRIFALKRVGRVGVSIKQKLVRIYWSNRLFRRNVFTRWIYLRKC